MCVCVLGCVWVIASCLISIYPSVLRRGVAFWRLRVLVRFSKCFTYKSTYWNRKYTYTERGCCSITKNIECLLHLQYGMLFEIITLNLFFYFIVKHCYQLLYITANLFKWHNYWLASTTRFKIWKDRKIALILFNNQAVIMNFQWQIEL